MVHNRTVRFFRFSGISLQPAALSTSYGITLIELLMVMVVMVIILSISVPAFVSMGRGADMRGAVSSVRSTIAMTRQWAITHREQVSFCYMSPTVKTNAACYFVTNAAGVLIQATNYLPLSVRFQNDGSISSVTFKTDGALAGLAYVNIYLVSSNAPQKEIEIAPLTGGIKVK